MAFMLLNFILFLSESLSLFNEMRRKERLYRKAVLMRKKRDKTHCAATTTKKE